MILDSTILIGVLAIVVLVLTVDIYCLRRKIKKMLRNEKACDICESIATLDADVKKLEGFRNEMESYLKNVEMRLRRSSQATETVRFDAFRGQGAGGGQSFATAFLNQDGDGCVLSSLYSRDRVSVFSKPIAKFESGQVSLSEEEHRAVSLAKAKLAAR
ncbi:DUF4446 family protein [Candidatus Parcubacteria bacterium]|nr:DUF4446 family protein [Candidatus Parcubacteria bacterium]